MLRWRATNSSVMWTVETMAFEEALGWLKAFDERIRRRLQDGDERGGNQLMLTAQQC